MSTTISFFGTDGIRAAVGTHILTPNGMLKLGIVLGNWAFQQGQSRPIIFVAHDTRISSDLLTSALITGLLHAPINVHALGVLPTPILEFITSTTPDSFGIMITASHNNYQDNGIKIFKNINNHATKINSEDELYITELFEKQETCTNRPINYENLGSYRYAQDSIESYKKFLVNNFKPNFLTTIKIVLDCANGAYSIYAPALLTHFGAQVITLNDKPNGKNINDSCGALHPKDLQQRVLQEKADIGFAFDGDGDRLITITPDGKVYSGDDTLALLMSHPAYNNQPAIIGTVMSNEGLAHHANAHDKKFIRTPVGDKYITKALLEHNLLLGGEPSGHTILRDLALSSDGLLTALRILETIILNNNWPLRSFTKLPQYTLSIPTQHKHDLTKEPYAQIIKEHELITKGRILVRYSGTEPLLRIMVEDQTEGNAQATALSLSKKLTKFL